MLAKFTIKTTAKNQMIDIMPEIKRIIAQSNCDDCTCNIFIPHSSAAITINLAQDAAVMSDMNSELNTLIQQRSYYKSTREPSDAHLKASLVGYSQNIFVLQGKIILGHYQTVYLWEFNGPKERTVYVNINKN